MYETEMKRKSHHSNQHKYLDLLPYFAGSTTPPPPQKKKIKKKKTQKKKKTTTKKVKGERKTYSNYYTTFMLDLDL